MKTSTKALLHSVVALLLCVSMLVGTTFAWFTDSVSSGVNKIQAGNLDIELEYLDGGDWKPVKSDKSVFPEGILWEPGHTEVVYLRIINKGNLALKYQLGIGVEGETLSVTESGDVIQLSKYIHFGAVNDVSVPFADRDAARAAVTESKALNMGYTKSGTMTATNETAYMALVVYMPESVGNEANHATGADAPTINMGIRLVATQLNSEMDSFGSDYDKDSLYPNGIIDFSATAPVTVNGEGKLENNVTVGEEGKIHAQVPAGALLKDGATDLGLNIETKAGSDSNVKVSAGETMKPMDISMPGLDPNNQELIKVTIPGLLQKGLNSTSVKMYHVEGNETKEMTLVSLADLDAHNEFYYDPATGDVTICTKSFSEYVAVTDNKNLWKGGFDTDWYNTTATEFTLTTADQLAGFGAIVDGTADGIEADTFAGKIIKLAADIDLSGGYSLNPIGCGYVDSSINSNGVTGRPFMGTFDGQGHTISNLYQNGWELGMSYNNLGGGLFASIANGTVKNLTITGANIVMECVEQGILVGLSQGNCTYDNIKIYNSKVANYQKATGGLIGEVSGAGTTTITNVTIGSDVVVGSLWGDFDAPCGGVIGARWANGADPQIVMNNVTVAARLDVYNDVTSSYQWYAYRRAGMLIGNTETSEKNANGTNVATAGFLKCENVVVKYGNWVNYHYCEFNNHNSSWPFVRVEAGENCTAFSNPRWGVPNGVNGVKVTPQNHTKVDDTGIHQDGDDCMVLLKFNQLYGGGQGVYGQTTHEGVTIENYIYTITYINNGKTLAVTYVKDNTTAYSTENTAAANAAVASMVEIDPAGTYEFGHWMNAGSTQMDSISAGNTDNVVLYPSFKDRYTVTYVDSQGTILHWETITAGTAKTKTTPAVPAIEGGYTGVWSRTDFSDISGDITVYPIYNANDGIVKLEPVDNEPKDGVIDHYIVTSVEENDNNINIVIPSSFNGKPVLEVSGGAFAEFDNITTVKIPVSITTIGADAFANKEKQSGIGGWLGGIKYEQITFYYEGSYEKWEAIIKDPKWDQYVGSGSHIFFKEVGDSGIRYLKKEGTNGYNASWKTYTSDPSSVDVYDATRWN